MQITCLSPCLFGFCSQGRKVKNFMAMVMVGRWCRLLLLLLASETSGWVLYGHHLAPENSRPKIYRWDAPADSTSDDGLGGAASPTKNTPWAHF